jgi:hypothetical protein
VVLCVIALVVFASIALAYEIWLASRAQALAVGPPPHVHCEASGGRRLPLSGVCAYYAETAPAR